MPTKTPKKKAAKKAVKIPTERPLSIQQELFCHFYVINDELRGNATHSYAEAYGFKLDELSNEDAIYEYYDEKTGEGKGKVLEPSTRSKAINVCAAESSRLLRTPKIQNRKIEMLNSLLRDDYVDSRLAKWIQDDSEPAASIAALREYNKLKQRITEKMDITSKGESIKGIEYIVPEPPQNETETGTDI